MFGLQEQSSRSVLKIFKLSRDLAVLDSLELNLGKKAVASFQDVQGDTLHGYISLYLQQKESNHLDVVRVNDSLRLVAHIEKTEVARLNNRSVLGSDPFYDGNVVYSLKSVADTGGRQFYLNKYRLKSEVQNYDYSFVWQHAFERKNIASARIMYANARFVAVFVCIQGGPKTGSWLLMVEAASGKLIKGKRLTEINEAATAFYAVSAYDRYQKTFEIAGSKFAHKHYHPESHQVSLASAPFYQVFYMKLDSNLDIVTRQDYNIPVTDQVSGAKKSAGGYLLKLVTLTKPKPGTLLLSCDVYRNSNNAPCFNYVNSLVLNLNTFQDPPVLGKCTVGNHPLIESYYYSQDKLDMNGKLCADSSNAVERVLYHTPTFPVKQGFKLDEAGNPVWILSKTLSKKNQISYSFLLPENKVYATKSIAEVNKSSGSAFVLLNEHRFLLGSPLEEGKFQIKLYNW